jgi:N-acetylmuramoyl-L-alanine amidase
VVQASSHCVLVRQSGFAAMRIFFAVTTLAILFFGPMAAFAAGPVATQVRVLQEDSESNLIVDLSQECALQITTMQKPRRLVIELPGLRIIGNHGATLSSGPVKAIRAGAFMRGHARLILELDRPLLPTEPKYVDLPGGGKRLVLRLAKASEQEFAARSLVPPKEDSEFSLITGAITGARAQVRKPVVMIDPGHGGIDSGASGPGGELEKIIVLNFALALRDRLNAGGKITPMLTRTDDVFVPLNQRVQMARDAKADLLVSLHADALADEAGVRGASVYVLSDRASDERSRRLAERENKADLVAGIENLEEKDEVADILLDLARREGRAFSNQFARNLIATLPRATPMHKTPLRGAGFRVLRSGEIPSVLLELGYLTTAEDAKMMLGEKWRRDTADAAAEAMERFLQDKIR